MCISQVQELDDQVSLINYKKLRHMGIVVATAPDLAKAFKMPIYYDNISEKGYITEFWILANCVIATFEWPALERVLIEHKIVGKRERL
jgi:hypothetical protein